MPILTAMPIQVVDREEFHRIDRQVTGFAFDIHNEFCRYVHESLYQQELGRRLQEAGYHVVLEYEMTVRLGDFSKLYFADLLVNSGVIVETKAVNTLTNLHQGQTLNYLYMCDLHHATLLNFRSQRVEHEFVSTAISRNDRLRYQMDATKWAPYSEECEPLKQHLLRCLAEWGAFLDPHLYRDALLHFFGGKQVAERTVPVVFQGTIVGTQRVRMINDRVAFAVTASVHRPESVLEHQKRFLKHTSLHALHWINFNRHFIEVRTITP